MTGGLDTRVIPRIPPVMLRRCFQVIPLVACIATPMMFVSDGRSRVSCRQTHRVIPVGEEFLTGFAAFAERCMFITEGTVDLLSCLRSLPCSTKVREVAPAKIAGTYGRKRLCAVPSCSSRSILTRDCSTQAFYPSSTKRERRTRRFGSSTQLRSPRFGSLRGTITEFWLSNRAS